MSDLTSPAACNSSLPNPAVSSSDPSHENTVKLSARSAGLGRVLVAVYLILAIAATFRSTFQILRKFDEAPVAYLLSALAGVVYIVATIALMRPGKVWRRIAWAALSFELAGVLIVGTLSFIAPQWFAHPSVWSWFGMGYLFIPLVLPVLGLIWLAKTAPVDAADSSGDTQ